MSTRSERKQNRIDRYNELARKAETKSIEAFEHSNSIVKCIPMGQPILVGHHSEKRHRRDLDKAGMLWGNQFRKARKQNIIAKSRGRRKQQCDLYRRRRLRRTAGGKDRTARKIATGDERSEQNREGQETHGGRKDRQAH